MADFIASVLPSQTVASKQDLLETLDVGRRWEKIEAELTRLIGILEIKDKIQSQVQDEVA
jgi:ATP-dependent Lon protease